MFSKVASRMAMVGRAPAKSFYGMSRKLIASHSTNTGRSIWNLPRGSHCRVLTQTGVRNFHGQSDKDLSEFLVGEINAEKESAHELPKLEGFTVEKSNGAELVISKKLDGETIRIRANVNNSMDDDSVEEDENAAPQMVCRPPMIVELTKDASPQTLCISCEFPHPSEISHDQEYVDSIEIRELVIVKKGEEWKNETFTVAGSVLDGTLYDLLLSMLEERGIDGKFCDHLVTYSTEYEHNMYIDFLEKFHAIAKSK